MLGIAPHSVFARAEYGRTMMEEMQAGKSAIGSAARLGMLLIGILIGAGVGFGVGFYFYVHVPQQNEIDQIELCSRVSQLVHLDGSDRLAGTELHRYILTNQNLIARAAGDSFHINGSYRRLISSEAPWGSYMILGSRVCVFEYDGVQYPTYRTIDRNGQDFIYKSYSDDGIELRSVFLSNDSSRAAADHGN